MIKIIITGKSGSGKSTLAAKLRAQGLRQAKLHVLGPKREHHNDDEYIYDKPVPNYKIIAFETYDQWTYSLSEEQAKQADFVVLPPAMIQHYKEYLNSVLDLLNWQYPIVIYLDYPRDVRLRRIYERDTIISDEAVRRLQSDEEDFQDFKDYTIRVDSDFLYP